MTKPSQGIEMTPSGMVLYQAEPVRLYPEANLNPTTAAIDGVFIIAYLTAGERDEGDEAVHVAQVSLMVLAIASLLA